MTTVVWLIVLLLALGALAYFRISLIVTTAGVALLLLFSSTLDDLAVVPQLFAWAIFLAVLLPLSITPVRRGLVSDRFLPVMRRAMPSMSQTERDALEAGTVWWDGELFSGAPDWRLLRDTPAPRLTGEEQAFLDGPVEELCRLLDDWKVTHEEQDLPREAWQYIKDHGFFGMIIPKEHGGLGFSALAHSAVVMKIAGRSITAAVTVMVPNSLGPAELLLHYGTEEQKNHYLPRLACGEDVPCFALTGPEAGSDASSLPDTGVVCKGEFEGKQIVGIRLNWDKRYITLGPVATVLGLAFKLYDPEHLLGEKKSLGITLALIPTDTPGIDIGNRHFPLNMVFMNGPNRGHDVFIPLDWIIGGPARAGQGWRMLMESLAAGRSISLPALSTGAGKLVCRATGAYARIRKQFRQPIGRFEGVEEALARMAGHTYMMDAARVMTAGAVDQGEKPSVISAIVKYHLTERMRQVVNDAMDVQGGSAICLGPRNYLARIYQSIPISITVEGANILTRSLIIFGQGAVRCHPYVLKEMRALYNPDQRLASQDFDAALFGHIGFALSNAVRALWLGLTGARLASTPVQGPERVYYQRITRLSAAFAFAADVGMLSLGGALKRKEKLSARYGDVLSQLYLASAALKRYADQGRPADDLPLLRWGCEEALHTAQEQLDELLRNFPNALVGRLVRWVIFPLGKRYARPSDRLGHKVASLLISPSDTRDRLTAGLFIPDNAAEPLARLENTLHQVLRAEAVEKKIKQAVKASRLKRVVGHEDMLVAALEAKIINAAEADMVRNAERARREVIAVDDFPPSYFGR